MYKVDINSRKLLQTEEVKMIRCLLLCRRNKKRKEDKKVRKGKKVVMLEEEKIVRQAVNDKEDWEREEKVEVDYRKIEEIVPKKFLRCQGQTDGE